MLCLDILFQMVDLSFCETYMLSFIDIHGIYAPIYYLRCIKFQPLQYGIELHYYNYAHYILQKTIVKLNI